MIDVDIEQRARGVPSRRPGSPRRPPSWVSSAVRARARPASSTRSPASRSRGAARFASTTRSCSMPRDASTCRRRSGGWATCSRMRCSFRTWTWNRICSTASGCARPRIASSRSRVWSTSSASARCCTASPRTLSGGEKQRVAIGRALLAQPRILLMDEPLAALDVPRKTEILDYIERLRDELDIPIVYVSHSVTEITRLADTVVVVCGRKVPRRRRRRRRDGPTRRSSPRPAATRRDRCSTPA